MEHKRWRSTDFWLRTGRCWNVRPQDLAAATEMKVKPYMHAHFGCVLLGTSAPRSIRHQSLIFNQLTLLRQLYCLQTIKTCSLITPCFFSWECPATYNSAEDLKWVSLKSEPPEIQAMIKKWIHHKHNRKPACIYYKYTAFWEGGICLMHIK